MDPVSQGCDGSVIFELGNLRACRAGVVGEGRVRVRVPIKNLLQIQSGSATIGRNSGNSGKKLKKLLESIDEE